MNLRNFGDTIEYTAARTLIVDTQDPDTPILRSPPDGTATNDNTPILDWDSVGDNGDAGVAGYNVRIDTDVYTVTASTEYLALLEDGSYTWAVRAYDHAGNYGAWASERTLIVDTQDPNTPVLDSPPDDAAMNDDTPTLAWYPAMDNGDAGVAGYNVRIDTDVYTITASMTEYTALLEDGIHTWQVRAYDRAGNNSEYTAARTLIVDTQDPDTPVLDSPPDDAATNDNTPTLAWYPAMDNGDASVAGYNVRIDTDVYIVTTPMTAYTPTESLADGVYTWQVRAYDRAGNNSEYAAARTLIVDMQDPDTPILRSPPDDTATNDNTPTLDWDPAMDNGDASVAGYNVRINTDVYTVTASKTEYAPTRPLADGTYIWTVRAYDRAGNYGDWASERMLIVDTQDPDTPILRSPPDDAATNNDTPTLAWYPAMDHGDAGVAGYNVRIDTDVYTVTALMTEYTALLADGIYTWQVRAYDRAGNNSEYAAARTLIVDTQDPNTPVLRNPPDGAVTNDNTPTLDWDPTKDNGDAGVAGYNVQIDTDIYTVTASTEYPALLEDGTYTWTVRAYDRAGNSGEYVPPRDLTVDTQEPDTPELDSPPDNEVTSDNTLTFGWSAVTDNGPAGLAGYEIRIGADVYTVTASTAAYTPTEPLADGIYTWTVQAYDHAGNYSDHAPARTLTVDTQDPDTPVLDSPPDDTATNDNTPTLAWYPAMDNGDAGVAGYNVRIDTDVYTVTASTTAYTPTESLADGIYTWTVCVYDHAGNYSAWASECTLIVDTQDPDTPILRSPPDGAVTYDNTPTFDWDPVTDNGLAGVAGYTLKLQIDTDIYTYTVTMPTTEYTARLAGGVYTWTVRACDHAGNCSVWAPDRTLVVFYHIRFPLVLRDYPPRPVGSVNIEGGAACVHRSSVTLDLAATVTGDTVVEMRFSNNGVNWSSWEPYATTKSWTLRSGTSDLRTVYAQFKGSKGGESASASDQVYFFPNGNFEHGTIQPGWHKMENPLPVSIVQSVQERSGGTTLPADGSYAVLLGKTDYPCIYKGVPEGYAAVEQTFSLPPNVEKLTFKYIIWSQDASVGSVYDRFEVYINGELRFYDGNQVNDLDCKWWRVPSSDNPRGGQASGWAMGEVDLSVYAGQNVTISFQNHSRFDRWYNTYTYIDYVTIEGDW